jgi:hypothetical protein
MPAAGDEPGIKPSDRITVGASAKIVVQRTIDSHSISRGCTSISADVFNRLKGVFHVGLSSKY